MPQVHRYTETLQLPQEPQNQVACHQLQSSHGALYRAKSYFRGKSLLAVILAAVNQCSMDWRRSHSLCPCTLDTALGGKRLRRFCRRCGQKYSCAIVALIQSPDSSFSGRQYFHLLSSKFSQNQYIHPKRFSFCELTYQDPPNLPISRFIFKSTVTLAYSSQH